MSLWVIVDDSDLNIDYSPVVGRDSACVASEEAYGWCVQNEGRSSISQ